MIGKFGIGKLASYAVGHRISHICRTADDRYLSVSVNYRDLTSEADIAGHLDQEPEGEASSTGTAQDSPEANPCRRPRASVGKPPPTTTGPPSGRTRRGRQSAS